MALIPVEFEMNVIMARIKLNAKIVEASNRQKDVRNSTMCNCAQIRLGHLCNNPLIENKAQISKVNGSVMTCLLGGRMH
jgi:hypothetical protein